jgi:glycosyltransferase involved in cell wall biosynthesis
VKVLSVVVSLDPELGGTQAAATQMTRATQRAGVSNTVVAAATPEARERALSYVRRLEADGVDVEQFPAARWLPGANKLGVSFKAMRWLARRAGDYDVIHVHGVWGLTLIAALAAARVRRVPVVVTPHESLTAIDIETSQSGVRQRIKLALRALYLRWTAVFVVNSQLEADTSVPEIGADRVNVTYHPVVEPDTPHAEPRSLGTGERLRVGFLGRLHPKKNLPLVIDALAQLPDHVVLVVAGGGELLDDMKRHAERRGVQGRVQWLGFVSPDERTRFLEGIDVLVMPSTFESFGMSAAEAMLDGVPVIVSEPTGIAEVIGRHEAGIVVPPDAESVAAAIERLDRDRGSLAELGRRGQEAVREELSLEHAGASLRDAYERAVALGAHRA